MVELPLVDVEDEVDALVDTELELNVLDVPVVLLDETLVVTLVELAVDDVVCVTVVLVVLTVELVVDVIEVVLVTAGVLELVL